MELVLEITSSEQFLLGDNASKRFLPIGGVIGRAPDCEWAIPDQSRHLSGRHAQISSEGDGFYITDISTNGIFVNGSKSSLEKHKPYRLMSDDVFCMGDIEFRAIVHLDSDRQAYSSNPSLMQIERSEEKPMLDPLEMLRQRVPLDSAGLDSNETFAMERAGELGDWHAGSASMPDSVNGVEEVFSAPSMHSEHLPEDWLEFNVTNGEAGPGDGALKQEGVVPVAAPSPRPSNHTNNLHNTSVSTVDPHLMAFCRGLGVSREMLQTKGAVDTTEMMEQAGAALKETFAGMVAVMKSRASLKNEFRMDMTLVQMDKNNPFKFSVNEEQILKQFLSAKEDSFLPMPAAIQAGFTDIQQHQIGVMAAVQASLMQLLDKLNPERLEKKFDRGQAKGFSMAGKRAQYWEAYKEYHSDILQEESTFSSVFGDTFATTYKRQVDRLKAAKPEGRNVPSPRSRTALDLAQEK